MMRNFRFSRDLTVRVRTVEVGQHFGTAGLVETMDGEPIHETRTYPYGHDRVALDAAFRWLSEQRSITAGGQTHMAPRRDFVGRRGSGKGYYVYVSDGEPVRAAYVRERADRPGEWYIVGLVPLEEVPAAALKRLGLGA